MTQTDVDGNIIQVGDLLDPDNGELWRVEADCLRLIAAPTTTRAMLGADWRNETISLSRARFMRRVGANAST